MSSSSRAPLLFDRWSLTYDRASLQAATYRPVHDAVLRRVDDMSPATVLDLGCGTGRLTQRLADRCPESVVVGVDLSDGMLGKAARRLARPDARPPELVRADAVRLPFAPASVDLIVCTESFHWYRDQAAVLDGLAHVLADDGRLMIASIAAISAVGERVLRRATDVGGAPIRALPPARLRTLLEHAGFRVVDQRRVPRLSPIGWPVLTDARLG